jgi:hypothetical protein
MIFISSPLIRRNRADGIGRSLAGVCETLSGTLSGTVDVDGADPERDIVLGSTASVSPILFSSLREYASSWQPILEVALQSVRFFTERTSGMHTFKTRA